MSQQEQLSQQLPVVIQDELRSTSSVDSCNESDSPFYNVSHYYYDSEKKDLVKKEFSLFSAICKPCKPVYQKPCWYGTRDCLYYKLKLETSGTKMNTNSNMFKTS